MPNAFTHRCRFYSVVSSLPNLPAIKPLISRKTTLRMRSPKILTKPLDKTEKNQQLIIDVKEKEFEKAGRPGTELGKPAYVGSQVPYFNHCYFCQEPINEPADGFMIVSKMFQHWGGSIQAWYWTTRDGSAPLNMPTSLLILHALSAKNMGAEIIQFEPYWYFFDNGQANENLKLLETILT